MLQHCRVIDLCDERGLLAGYLFAHLGAEVILVEPPGGSPSRRTEPVPADGGDGFLWQAWARGRTSVTIDLESADGQRELDALVAGADFLLDSFSTDEATRLDIRYDRFAATNPGLVHASITAFGRSGPKASWPATDLTVWAASGALKLAGDDDRAPVRTSVPQSWLHGSADAVGAALIAWYERARSGLGQHVDASAQQSSAQAALSAILATPNESGMVVERVAGGLRAAMPLRLTWPCADGYVAITLLFGPAFAEPNRRLVQWLHDAGYCPAELVDVDWGVVVTEIATGIGDPAQYLDLCNRIEKLTLAHTQQELFEEGSRRGIYIAPTLDVDGLLNETHFNAREFWQRLDGDTRRYPGAFAKLSRTPLTLPGPAPANAASVATVTERQPSELPTHPDPGIQPALAGLKVVDLMWVIAGPFFTRALNDYGATVIRVESSSRVDPARTSPPFRDGELDYENSAAFHDFNAGKRGITLDLTKPEGREVYRDLVRWADVVTESFSPKAMRAWGLDYESLREINPSIIMISSCLMGQTGPRSQLPGYGNMAAALTGFYDLTGWQDRSPAGPYLAYTDGVSPRFMLISVLAALEHRRRTGEGQYIDLSQAEAAIHLLGPAVARAETDGEIWHRMGNRDLNMAPHGVYPTAGEDTWIAIACQDDAAWQVMRNLMPNAPDGLNTCADRLAAADRLDSLMSAWTATQDGAELERTLIEAGVAAHTVQNSPEAIRDPQLVHREHFAEVPRTNRSTMWVEGSRFRLSRTPAAVNHAGPELGEHNFEVLSEVLGYDDEQIANVIASLAME